MRGHAKHVKRNFVFLLNGNITTLMFLDIIISTINSETKKQHMKCRYNQLEVDERNMLSLTLNYHLHDAAEYIT